MLGGELLWPSFLEHGPGMLKFLPAKHRKCLDLEAVVARIRHQHRLEGVSAPDGAVGFEMSITEVLTDGAQLGAPAPDLVPAREASDGVSTHD